MLCNESLAVKISQVWISWSKIRENSIRLEESRTRYSLHTLLAHFTSCRQLGQVYEENFCKSPSNGIYHEIYLQLGMLHRGRIHYFHVVQFISGSCGFWLDGSSGFLVFASKKWNFILHVRWFSCPRFWDKSIRLSFSERSISFTIHSPCVFF